MRPLASGWPFGQLGSGPPAERVRRPCIYPWSGKLPEGVGFTTITQRRRLLSTIGSNDCTLGISNSNQGPLGASPYVAAACHGIPSPYC